jgi:hypothetical protein
MSDPQRIRDMIEVEVFLFGGVPEFANPVYGHDAHRYVHSRLTRTGIDGGAPPAEEALLPPSGKHNRQEIIIDHATGTIEFRTFNI